MSFHSPSTSSRCNEDKVEESSFIVKPYCKNKLKDASLDYAVIEYVDSSMLSPGPVPAEESKDPFKYLYYIFLKFYKSRIVFITKFCKIYPILCSPQTYLPTRAIEQDRGQDYLDMSGLTLVNLETFNVSSVEDSPPPPTPPKRE